MTLRDKLDVIDDWLCEDEGGKLAAVLSALRGPDDRDLQRNGTKHQTTCPIRAAAFPKLFTKYQHFLNKMNSTNPLDVLPSLPFPVPWEMREPSTYRAPSGQAEHFFQHIIDAANALNLKDPRPADNYRRHAYFDGFDDFYPPKDITR